MTHPNAERLETAYKALDAGDMQTIDQLWTDDIVWHIYGEEGPLPGDYRGKQAILGMLGSIPQTHRLGCARAVYRGTAAEPCHFGRCRSRPDTGVPASGPR